MNPILNTDRVTMLAEQELAKHIARQQAATMFAPTMPVTHTTHALAHDWSTSPQESQTVDRPVTLDALTATPKPPPEPKPSALPQSGTATPTVEAETAPARKLADAFDVLEPQESWKPSTTTEYRSLVRRWQEYHDGDGPDVDQITEDMLIQFLHSVKTWRSHDTRLKQLMIITKIIKAVAPKTGRARYGMRASQAWLSEVPFVRLRKPDKQTKATAWRQTTITVEDIGRLYTAAGKMPEPIRWQTLLVMAWLYGPRRGDLLLMPWDAFDFDKTVLCYNETKGEHPVGPLPLPDYVIAHLEACRKQNWSGSVLGYEPDDIRNRGGRFYSALYEIYELAGVDVLTNSGGKRIPLHGLRSACITNWRSHAPGLQRFVVGHQTADVSDNHYARFGDEMKEKIKTLPIPDVFHNYT